jgi:hypothetical protein
MVFWLLQRAGCHLWCTDRAPRKEFGWPLFEAGTAHVDTDRSGHEFAFALALQALQLGNRLEHMPVFLMRPSRAVVEDSSRLIEIQVMLGT